MAGWKSPFLIGDTPSIGCFSVVMLVFRGAFFGSSLAHALKCMVDFHRFHTLTHSMFGLPAEDSHIWICVFCTWLKHHIMSKTTCVFFGSGPKIGGKDAKLNDQKL